MSAATTTDAPMRETDYYLQLDDKEQGPFTIRQLRSLWDAAKITSETLYTQPGMAGWRPLSDILSTIEPCKAAKSRLGYIILGVCFGTLGIHNFYAGYVGKGVLQLALCIYGVAGAGAGTKFGLPLLAILFFWAIMEVFTIKTDAKGDQLL